MSSHQKKYRYPSEWQYAVRLRCNQQIPLLTTEQGVQAILVHNNVQLACTQQFFDLLNRGEHYIPTHGVIQCVFKRLPVMEERLKEIAALVIKKTGPTTCWWNGDTGAVWWSVAEEDWPFVQHGNEHVSSEEEIRKAFHIYKEVVSVRIELEACPNIRRYPRWVEVFPGRL
jgi:hypothetical protein